MKLYNAGSFFDPRAVPDRRLRRRRRTSRRPHARHRRIASRRSSATRTRRFRDALSSSSARGHAAAGTRGRDGSRDRASRSARAAQQADDASTTSSRPPIVCESRGAALRVFLLVSPPFVPDARSGRMAARVRLTSPAARRVGHFADSDAARETARSRRSRKTDGSVSHGCSRSSAAWRSRRRGWPKRAPRTRLRRSLGSGSVC